MLDIPNRSNSTHAMILEAIEYKIVLKRYTTSQQQPFPTELEWSKTESIGKFLGVFEETTMAFSADRFPTSHLFLINVLYIHQALRSHAWQDDQVIKELARAMDKKFDKYWDGNYNIEASPHKRGPQSQEADNTFITSNGTSPYNSTW